VLKESQSILKNALAFFYYMSIRRKSTRINDAGEANDYMTCERNPDGKEILVFDSIDRRLTTEDFFVKLALCYGNE